MSQLELQLPESPTGSDLGILRSNDNYYIPITAYDPAPQLGPVTYSLTDLIDGGVASCTSATYGTNIFDLGDSSAGSNITTSTLGSAVPSSSWLPSTLHLDPATGYIFGYVPTQTEYLKKYSISISATKTSLTDSTTTVNTFTLGILNNNPDIISWVSSSTLSITQGLVSELSILATHTETQSALQYSFVGTNTPYLSGLTLTNSGNIVGQTTATGIFTATVVAWNPYYPVISVNGGVANQPQDYDAYGGYSNAFNGTTLTNIDLSIMLDGGYATSTSTDTIISGGTASVGFIRPLHDTDGGASASVYSINNLSTDGGSSQSLYGSNETFLDGGKTGSIYFDYDANGGYAATMFSEEDPIADGSNAQFIPIFDTSLRGPTYPYPFSVQNLTINITDSLDNLPYTGIYVRPFLSIAKRQSYSAFINNTKIFSPDLLYRGDDPNFGVQKDIKMFLEFGIQSINLEDYTPALWENFNRRRLTFGNVKTARAKDQLGNYLYDVIYVDIVDNINGVVSTIYDNDTIYYPASIANMRTQLESIILPNYTYISVDQYHLPKFMQTAQPGTYLPTNYIKVVPLCYVQPGRSSSIVDQIRLSKFDFKLYDFEIDRLIIQNSLNYNTAKYMIFPRRSLTSAIQQDNLIFIDPTTSTSFITDESGDLLLRD